MPKEIVCIVMNDAEKVGVFYGFFCTKDWMFFYLASHEYIVYICVCMYKYNEYNYKYLRDDIMNSSFNMLISIISITSNDYILQILFYVMIKDNRNHV